MFERVNEELLRTNNSIEGWHRAFQANVVACHPTFYRFLTHLSRKKWLSEFQSYKHLVAIHHQLLDADVTIATKNNQNCK